METSEEFRRLTELARRAAHANAPVFTRFLDPAQIRDAQRAAAQNEVQVEFFGGFADAERRIAAFSADGDCPETAYPLVAIEMRWNARYAEPAHRDLLGAVMGLGLERDATGDIAFLEAPGCACLFAHRDVCAYILGSLESAGHATLKLRALDSADEALRLRPPEGDALRVTVLNERLDAVLASGYKLSRSEAQKLIAQGLVKRNHLEERRGDVRLLPGDLISARGLGRLKVVEFMGETKKGRQAVCLFRYKH